MQSGGPTVIDHHRLIPKSLLASKDVEIFFDHLDRNCSSSAEEDIWCGGQERKSEQAGKGDQSPHGTHQARNSPEYLDSFKTEERRSERLCQDVKESGGDHSEEHSFPTESCINNATTRGDSFDANDYSCRNDCSSTSNNSNNSTSSHSGNTSPISEADKRLQGIRCTPTLTFSGNDLHPRKDSEGPPIGSGPRFASFNAAGIKNNLKEKGNPNHHQQQQEPLQQHQFSSMYQGGIALTPSAAGYGQDSMTNGYLHSGKFIFMSGYIFISHQNYTNQHVIQFFSLYL